MPIQVCSEMYTVELVESNPEKIYIFGDNLARKGKGGQAIIRDCMNTYGIPTKRSPSMHDNAFFADRIDEQTALEEDLDNLELMVRAGYTVVLPAAGLGTGLAKMQEKSPYLFKLMNDRLEAMKEEFHFGRDIE